MLLQQLFLAGKGKELLGLFFITRLEDCARLTAHPNDYFQDISFGLQLSIYFWKTFFITLLQFFPLQELRGVYEKVKKAAHNVQYIEVEARIKTKSRLDYYNTSIPLCRECQRDAEVWANDLLAGSSNHCRSASSCSFDVLFLAITGLLSFSRWSDSLSLSLLLYHVCFCPRPRLPLPRFRLEAWR